MPSTMSIEEETRITHRETKTNTKIKNPKQSSRTRTMTKPIDLTFTIPKIGEHQQLLIHNYRVSQLREMCKKYRQKRSGTKQELLTRMFDFLKSSHAAIQFQKIWKGYLVREYTRCKGLAIGKRHECTNEVDFLLMTPISEIPFSNIFVYQDTDNFLYGFDITSLTNLITKSEKNIQNPYNRKPFPESIPRRVRKMTRLGKLLGYDIDTSLHEEDVLALMSPRKRLEMQTIDLCQRIDALGNHTSTEWFLSLRASDYIVMLRELWDIWHYRANILHSVRQEICPPIGNPFVGVDLSYLRRMNDLSVCQKSISILERFVTSGINDESKSLGAIYVLSALTLVSLEAAQALPWLYQSVAHV